MGSSMGRLQSWATGNRGAVALLLLYLILATAYNLADPILEPPDEIHHFDFVLYLKREGRLPVVDLAAPGTEYHQPPLYYAIAAFLTAPLPEGDLGPHTLRNPFWGYDIGSTSRDNKNQYLHGPSQRLPGDDATRAIHLTRMFSTLYGCGTVLATYLLARQFVTKGLALASMAVVAFTPNFLLTSGAVTNDSLAISMSAAAGLVIVRITASTTPPPLRQWLGLGVLLGLGALTKISVWPLSAVALLAVTLLALRLRSWRLFLTGGVVVAAAVALLGGWWMLRSVLLHGDLTGMSSMWAVWGEREPLTWHTFRAELPHFRTTFWANFGYGNIPLPAWVYATLDLFVVGGLVGSLVAAVRRLGRNSVGAVRRNQLITLSAWALLTLVSLFWYLQRTIAVTGRQIYSILPLIALGLVVGWAALVPRRARVWVAGVICLLMFALAVGSWLFVLIPAYRPSPRLSAEEAAQEIQHRLAWQFGDVATLLGYDLAPEAVAAGEKAIVTLYWQPRSTPNRNLATFVHLLGAGNEPVGARDTYPGLGNDPTTYWTPGEILADSIPIPVVPDATGPILLDIETGLYDLDTGDRLQVRDSAGKTIMHPVIGTVKLKGDPGIKKDPSQLQEARFRGGLVLQGYDLPTTEIKPGSGIMLVLHWAPAGPLPAELTTFVHLVDEEGQIVAQGDAPPFNGRYPTTAWAAGEHLQDQYELTPGPDLKPGSYHLLVGLYDPRDGSRLPLAEGGDQIRLDQALSVQP